MTEIADNIGLVNLVLLKSIDNKVYSLQIKIKRENNKILKRSDI